jgi:hypothetical protein
MLKELAQTDLKREIEINIGQSHCMHAWTIWESTEEDRSVNVSHLQW